MVVRNEKEKPHGDALPQYILCLIVNLVSFAYGVTVGWLAPMQPILQANYTNTNETSPLGPEAEPLTYDEISWISGTFCIGGIVGTLTYGMIANLIGRKKTTLLCALPFIVTYTLTLFANNALMIFVGRFFAGLGGGGASVMAPMYIGETAEDHIRGILGSFFNLFACLGILLSFIIGSYTSYVVLGVFCLSVPILYVVLSFWLPETPVYSLLKNNTEDALNALIKLRGNHKELIEEELATLTSSMKEMTGDGDKMSFKEMISEPETRKGFIIGGVLMTVQQMSGVSPILNYTVAIFQASGSDLSPNLAAIIVGFLQVIGAVAATLLMDRAGRKLLLMISSVGMCLSLAPIALFFQLKSMDYDPELMTSIGWIPVLSLAVYIIVYGLGFGPVPFVLIAEIFKTEARSSATSFSTFLIWAEAFFLLKFFSKLSDLIGIGACFGIFSIFCGLGAVFTYFYVPETKGKSLETILWQLGGREPSKGQESGSPIPLVNLDGKKTSEFLDGDRIDEKI